MKKSIFLLCALTTLFFFGCGDDDKKLSHRLIVSDHSLEFENNGGSQSFEVASNVYWTVMVDETWCTVSPSIGHENGTVNVNVTANNGADSRTAVVTVYNTEHGLSEKISISQEGNPQGNGNGTETVYLLSEISDDDGWSAKYTYDDQNRIKTISYEDEDGVYAVITLYYDSNGDLIMEEREYAGEISTQTYTKRGNNIIFNGGVSTMELNDQGLPVMIRWEETEYYSNISTYKYQGHNVTEYSSKVTFNDYSYYSEHRYSFTYDDMKTPFYYCNTPQWWLIYYGLEIGSRNNPKTSTWNHTRIENEELEDETSVTDTMEYTYNSYGFPETKAHYYEEEPQPYTVTYKYYTPTAKSAVETTTNKQAEVELKK